jgi:leucyl-tRNA synthetase
MDELTNSADSLPDSAALLVESEMEIPMQVNGKLPDVIRVPANADSAALEAAARARRSSNRSSGKTTKEVIVMPRKLLSIAVGQPDHIL